MAEAVGSRARITAAVRGWSASWGNKLRQLPPRLRLREIVHAKEDEKKVVKRFSIRFREGGRCAAVKL